MNTNMPELRVIYYESGRPMTCTTYNNADVKHGPEQCYLENGILIMDEHYENGLLHGECKYYIRPEYRTSATAPHHLHRVSIYEHGKELECIYRDIRLGVVKITYQYKDIGQMAWTGATQYCCLSHVEPGSFD